MAESVLVAQDLGDAVGFSLAVLAMVAFYLADDRALEALDALTEAREVARGFEDPEIAQRLHNTAESRLRHLGILAK